MKRILTSAILTTAVCTLAAGNLLAYPGHYDCLVVAGSLLDHSPTTTDLHEGQGVMPGVLIFESGSANFNPLMLKQLSILAEAMKIDPDCKVVIIGNGGGSRPNNAEMSKKRVDAVIEHMSSVHGIEPSRFISWIGYPGPDTQVSYRTAGLNDRP